MGGKVRGSVDKCCSCCMFCTVSDETLKLRVRLMGVTLKNKESLLITFCHSMNCVIVLSKLIIQQCFTFVCTTALLKWISDSPIQSYGKTL
jgi:hypothetical protein